MSGRPSDGVFGMVFAVHGTRGLRVMNPPVFLMNLGGNRQLPIMGIARCAANMIAEAGI